MGRRKTSGTSAKGHLFGGDWTTAKLDVLARYLTSYTTALKDKPSKERPFRKGYIDAFAGSGYRDTRREDEAGERGQALLLPDLAADEPQALLDGSARLALKTEPRFDRYIFIDRSAERCAQLEALKVEFPHLASDIEIRQGDANAEIQEVCGKDWSSHRAVLFLDPYGMQVEWKTIEAIAATKAIDLWLLFPLGIGVNRLLTRSGDIPPSWRRRLNLLLGNEDWYEEFYAVETRPTLFGGSEERVVKASMETIGRYFNDRLREVFAGVVEEPGVLRNSANNPLYLLCFAVGNERGRDICGAHRGTPAQGDALMAQGSGIEWTESTWNPVTGCTKISPGCKYCYAERMAQRLQVMRQANYSNGFALTLQPHMLELPLKWKKPQVIFVNSMSDLFHEDVPVEYVQRVFDVMRRADWHRFQVLTKRSARLAELDPNLHWAPNIWMGVSVESDEYRLRIDELRATQARLKFLSLEPLLGPLHNLDLRGIDWVIVGGESGHKARPMNPAWAIDVRDQCRRERVPFFFKQWGGRNKKQAGRILEGQTWNQMPGCSRAVQTEERPDP